MIMKTIIALSLLFLACSTSAATKSISGPPAAPQDAEPKRIIQEATWEPIFFEEIDKRARVARLRRLRSAVLPGDDLEARVWVGFGLSALEGLIIKRASGRWSAVHLEGVYPGLPESEYQKALAPPKSGWESFWRRIEGEGFLTLPDASEARCNTHVKDGVSYVVEINMNQTYRTYMYDNPHHAECDEARRIVRIGQIIAGEFGVKEFGVS